MQTLRIAFTLALAAAAAGSELSYVQAATTTTDGDTGVSTVTKPKKMDYPNSKLNNNKPVFNDKEHSSWRDVPKRLQGCDTLVPDHKVGAGDKCQIQCDGTTHCELFVFLYRCGGCEYDDGGLPALLLDDGWSQFRCTPRMQVVENGYAHRTIGFHKVVEPTVLYTLTFLAAAEYVSIAVKCDGLLCSDHDSKDACLADDTFGQCEWDSDTDTCIDTSCTGNGWQGPGSEVCEDHCITAEDLA